MAKVLPYHHDGEVDVNHVGDISRSATAEHFVLPPRPEKGGTYSPVISPAYSINNDFDSFSDTDQPANFTTSADDVDDIAELEMSRDAQELPKTAHLDSQNPSFVEPKVNTEHRGRSRHRQIATLSGLTSTGRVRKGTRGKPHHGCVFCGKVYTRLEHLRRHQGKHTRGTYACTAPGCTCTFQNPALLERHRRHDWGFPFELPETYLFHCPSCPELSHQSSHPELSHQSAHLTRAQLVTPSEDGHTVSNSPTTAYADFSPGPEITLDITSFSPPSRYLSPISPLQTGTEPGRSIFPAVISSDGHGSSSAPDGDKLRGLEVLQDDGSICQKLADVKQEVRESDQLEGPSRNEVLRVVSDTDSVTSSGESMDDLDDLLLDTEISRLRTWLFERSESEHFCRHLKHQLTYGRYEPSALQEQSTDSTPRSSSLPKSSVSSSSSSSSSTSSSTTSVSCGPVIDGKRRQDDESGQDERQHKKKRFAQDGSENKPAPRLACLFNKYDPMMYRSNAQTNKKFEICGMHDFQNMNKLYEHLKRVHSDQPLQCPRCTSTSFRSSEELQAHQTASEPCTLVPLDAVKRIRWITHDDRLALQSAVARRLRGSTDEDKWRFAYRWLFPHTNAENTPCPYLEDPVISIVSSVVDDFDTRLREYIRTSSDLSELEGRISEIRGQFLAQYGIMVNEDEQDPLSLTSLRTVSSSSSSGRLTTTTPLDVADLDQQYLGGYTTHSQTNPSSNHQPSLNVLPPESNALQDISLEPPATSDPVGLQIEFADFDDSILSWDPNHDLWNYDHGTTNENEK